MITLKIHCEIGRLDELVKGIKDGGGGITYAIRYEVNGISYFNGAPEGELNTYTLKNE